MHSAARRLLSESFSAPENVFRFLTLFLNHCFTGIVVLLVSWGLPCLQVRFPFLRPHIHHHEIVLLAEVDDFLSFFLLRPNGCTSLSRDSSPTMLLKSLITMVFTWPLPSWCIMALIWWSHFLYISSLSGSVDGIYIWTITIWFALTISSQIKIYLYNIPPLSQFNIISQH